MKLKRHHYSKLNVFLCMPFYILILLCLVMIILLNYIGIKDFCKVDGYYANNTITFTTLDGINVSFVENSINIYEENSNFLIYYNPLDYNEFKTSVIMDLDCTNSIYIIVVFSIGYGLIVLNYLIKLINDNKIIKNGKLVTLKISKINFIEDKKLGNHLYIISKYKDEENNIYLFYSDKIYNKKQRALIENDAKVNVYFLKKDPKKYVMLEYLDK